MPDLIDNPIQAIENILRYQTQLQPEIRKSRELVRRMTAARVWYAIESNDGTWLFGPSKFIGYVGLTAETYVQMSAKGYEPAADRLDGKKTERRLMRWFERPTERIAECEDALRRFLVDGHKHTRPNAAAGVLVLKDAYAHVAKALPAREIGDRICVDPAICGGRPHIRGTRVPVSDILDILAAGASRQDILADYPYLKDADLKAALAFGAAASAHRIVVAA